MLLENPKVKGTKAQIADISLHQHWPSLIVDFLTIPSAFRCVKDICCDFLTVPVLSLPEAQRNGEKLKDQRSRKAMLRERNAKQHQALFLSLTPPYSKRCNGYPHHQLSRGLQPTAHIPTHGMDQKFHPANLGEWKTMKTRGPLTCPFALHKQGVQVK
eukprot:TRINITY_DN23242_c0_g1_i1.p1 TRINITY_DN23242_c0_g1~~TRINITY_DN23242_c0_g1_i1.p1  ORF type:complete len:158 (+),score=18.53 TRINITY_DN23242_c0_g1_i1:91-564(+)